MTKYVGHSYGRCILDIYEGRVNYNDIGVIITRTRFDPLDYETWEKSIWNGYTQYDGISSSYWIDYIKNDEAKAQFYDITKMLHEDGLLYQPRNIGAKCAWSMPYVWSKIDTVSYDEMQKSDDERWSLPEKKSKLSGDDLDKILGYFI